MALVIGVALLVGFRPTSTPVEWVAVAGVLAMSTFALIWLCAALGLAAKTVESASNTPMPLTLLPFLGSGFVPTDSIPPALRAFAEYQPFSPFIETVRGLLMGTRIGGSGLQDSPGAPASRWSATCGRAGSTTAIPRRRPKWLL